MAGRHRINPELKKSQNIKVHCTKSERERITENAAGESLSAFLLKCALTKKNTFQQLDPELIKLKIQLRKVGNNLNQLTRIANAKKEIASQKDLIRVLSGIEMIIKDILKRL